MLSNGFWSRVRRYPRAGYIGGVCAGLSAYYDFNVKILRILAVVAVFCLGWPLIVYAVLWYLMESDPGIPDGLPPAGWRDRGRGGPSPSCSPAGMSAPMSSGDLRARFARIEERLRNMETCVSSSEYELRKELRKLEA